MATTPSSGVGAVRPVTSTRTAAGPRAGRPVGRALARLPFAIAFVLILAAGVGGSLYVGTKTDESGVRTEQALEASRELRLTIEELTRQAAALSATPRIAAAARALGLVPAGDAAIITVAEDGSATLLATPGGPDEQDAP